ncbi:hypothetical protein Gotri_004386, partial [Gossypium trilobum]|nr:hypothetical protein [Gossypium trilobum]
MGTSVKINFDATFDLRQYRFGLGMVIRDANGGVLASKFVLNRDVSSPFATEALAWAYIRNIKQNKMKFQNMCFKYTPRMVNLVAHKATESLKKGEQVCLEGGAPDYALGSLEVDQRR